MITLPAPPSLIERALAQWYTERLTGKTGVTLTLSYVVAQTLDQQSLIWVSKNGALLDTAGGAGGFSVSGNTITLGTAAIAGDVFLFFYVYRS